MNCVVTGGAGFIGSHLVDALVERGDRVAVLDDLSSGKRENLAGALQRGVTLHAADVRSGADLSAVFADERPEVVFHLAAHVDVTSSVRDPAGDTITNVLGTIGVLEAARAAGARRFVNSSSGGAVYGEARIIPTPEDHPAKPLSPYGQGKFAGEGYCELYARAYGLSTVSLRYANVYGPRQAAHLEGGVVAIFSACLAGGRRPVIYGDGRQTRDWVEVSDVVRANLLAADAALTGPVNIARGTETSVLELVQALNEASDRGPLAEPEFAPARPGEVGRSCLDVTRAREALGWEPRVELRDGVRRVIEAV
jgi:UDP-glucose 4-epimerase